MSLLAFVESELMSALQALPLWFAAGSFFGHSLVFPPQCAIPFLCKMLLLLLGLHYKTLAFGEIEESLRAFTIEKL